MAQLFGVDHKYVALSSVAISAGVAAYAFYRLQKIHDATVDQAQTAGAELYESKKLLSEYLVFHFGTPEQLIPYPFGPKDALDFPKRCAELCLKHYNKQPGVPDRALDIGCAVGRSSFELTTGVSEVIGIDYSQSFIDAANVLKRDGKMNYEIVQEGHIFTPVVAEIDKSIDCSKVTFEQGDACNLRTGLGSFGVVLAANLICRLHHPKEFLKDLTKLLPNKGSVLVITAPYTWLEDYTNKESWLGGYVTSSGEKVTGFSALKRELGSTFDLVEEVNMPFFIRETARKNQWTVAHASVWRRK